MGNQSVTVSEVSSIPSDAIDMNFPGDFPAFYKNYSTLGSLASAVGGFNIGWTTISIGANVKTKLFTADIARPFIVVIRNAGYSCVFMGIGYSDTSIANSSRKVLTSFGDDNTLNRISIETVSGDTNHSDVFYTPETARTGLEYKWFYL